MNLVSDHRALLAAALVLCLYIPNVHSRTIRKLDKINRLPKQTKQLLKQEKQRLLDLNETDEIKEVNIIYDARRIPKILEKPRDENGDVVGGFDPIELPTDFASYDVAPVDGLIDLQELIAVTGAVENVEAAFNATDVDGDGLINADEFADAPWMMNMEIIEPSTVVPQQLANISTQTIDGGDIPVMEPSTVVPQQLANMSTQTIDGGDIPEMNMEIIEPSTVVPQQLANMLTQKIDGGDIPEINNKEQNDYQSEIMKDEDESIDDVEQDFESDKPLTVNFY